ncbi:MAG: hypothetical protein HUU55_01145 [Myxococcales bacterium]|nr:hypothetical protein [Myxococcales bacterium]
MAVSPEVRHACYQCKEELIFDVKIGRRDMCPNCGAYLHCCFNCKFWDKNVHNQCTENQGEFIRDRAEGNFCLYFTFREVPEDTTTDADRARAKLDALFGKPNAAAPSAVSGPPKKLTPEEEARKKLESLFKK